MADGGRLGLTPARLAALARCAIKGASRPRRGLHLVTAHYDGSGVAEEYAERLAMSAKRTIICFRSCRRGAHWPLMIDARVMW